MIFHEAPHKLRPTLADFCEAFGPERRIALCRELTKLHEEVRRCTLGEAAEYYRDHDPRGEYVLVVAGAERSKAAVLTLEEGAAQVLALVDAGITREDAYVIVQRNAMKVWEDIQNAVDGPTYRERLEADPEANLSAEVLDEIFDPWDFLTRKDVVFERLEGLEF